MYLTACPHHSSGSIPGHGEEFEEFVTAWLITLCQLVLSQQWQKMAHSLFNGTTKPV